jgi:hypothetical protein
MMNRFSLILLLLLASCASGPQLPPGLPTSASIEAKRIDLGAPKTPSAYLTIGSVLDDETCYGWLDQQILGSQQSSAAQGALGTLGAISAMVGGPYGMGGAVGAGALSSLLGNAQANSAIGIDPIAVYGLIVRQRLAWQAAASIPMTREDAFAFLASYHQPCSLGGIRWAMHVAAMMAPVTAVSSYSALASAPPRALPPVVTIGTPR